MLSVKPQIEKKQLKLTPEIEAQLKEAFAVFDVSGDGQIDAGELSTILEAVMNRKFTEVEVREMIEAVDDGGDGEIELPEFLQLMSDHMLQQEPDEELIAAFKFFGVEDVDDQISIEKLSEVLAANGDNFTDTELKMIFEEIAGASRKPLLRRDGPA